jgi:hypothetical protein
MGSRLVNVRLDEARLRKAQALRARGIALSDVVREAIDERFAATAAGARPTDVRAALGEILRAYPDPSHTPARGYDVHDARQARAAVAARLRRHRR